MACKTIELGYRTRLRKEETPDLGGGGVLHRVRRLNCYRKV